MIIRVANKEDFKKLAILHMDAFPGFFLTTLGHGFLSTYYRNLLKSKEGIVICIVDDSDKLLGFAAGSIRAENFHRNLLKNNIISFFLAVLKSAFNRPGIIYRLFYNLEKNAVSSDNGDYAELLSIAVCPKRKGSGIGKKLLSSFEAEVVKRGGAKLALTTDFNNNDSVIGFYLKCGYSVFYDFVTYPNRRMYKMMKIF